MNDDGNCDDDAGDHHETMMTMHHHSAGNGDEGTSTSCPTKLGGRWLACWGVGNDDHDESDDDDGGDDNIFPKTTSILCLD